MVLLGVEIFKFFKTIGKTNKKRTFFYANSADFKIHFVFNVCL